MEIRTLNEADDLAAAAQVFVMSWQSAYRSILPDRFLDRLTVERWLPLLRAEPHMSLGLFDGEKIAGIAQIGFPRDEERIGYGEIVSLYLLPEYTGQGLGRRLLQAAVERLEQEGCKQACLWVMQQNTRAIGFYTHLGFRPTGRMQAERYGSAEAPLCEMAMSGQLL